MKTPSPVHFHFFTFWYITMSNYQMSDVLHPTDQKKKSCNLCVVFSTSFFTFLLGLGLMFCILRFGWFVPPFSPSPSQSNNTNNTSLGCSLASDVFILVTKGNAMLDAEDKCGNAALGDSTATAKCLEKTMGLSKSCAFVFGDQTECGRNQCWIPCISGKPTPKCTKCICQHCRKKTVKSSRIPCTLMPSDDCNDCPGWLPPVGDAPSPGLM